MTRSPLPYNFSVGATSLYCVLGILTLIAASHSDETTTAFLLAFAGGFCALVLLVSSRPTSSGPDVAAFVLTLLSVLGGGVIFALVLGQSTVPVAAGVVVAALWAAAIALWSQACTTRTASATAHR